MSIEIDRPAADELAVDVYSAVLHSEGFRCPRPRLERRFRDVAPLALNDAIALLLADGRLLDDGDELHAPLAGEDRATIEHLAAAVNAVLVAGDRLPFTVAGEPRALTVDEVCVEAERSPAMPEERREILLALALLDYCQLATRDDDGRWRPTRAAAWAERLAF